MLPGLAIPLVGVMETVQVPAVPGAVTLKLAELVVPVAVSETGLVAPDTVQPPTALKATLIEVSDPPLRLIWYADVAPGANDVGPTRLMVAEVVELVLQLIETLPFGSTVIDE